MTILCDWQIAEYCKRPEPMVFPFTDQLVRYHGNSRVVSYGLSSAGYDIRLGHKFTRRIDGIADPHRDQLEAEHVTTTDDRYIIAPRDCVLAVSLESFTMPDEIVGVCLGKSTYARLGLIVNVTPLEPGWKGYLTMELHNASSHPIVVHSGEGIAQIMFHRIAVPDTTYAMRGGKYQNQPAVPVTAKL